MTKNRDKIANRDTPSRGGTTPPPVHDCALLAPFRPCSPGGLCTPLVEGKIRSPSRSISWLESSQVTYVTMVPRMGNETLRPLGVATDSSLRRRGTQTLSRERHAHRWPSIVRGAMLARPARRATYHRALRSGELIPQNERERRRSEGSGMLIGDPLVRGAMLALPTASSGERRTHSSEWEGTQMLRRERHAQRWPSRWGEQC